MTSQWKELGLGFLYIRANAKAKAIFFFDLLPITHRCSINTQIGNNATDWKRCRFRFHFRSNINAPLHIYLLDVTYLTESPLYHWQDQLLTGLQIVLQLFSFFSSVRIFFPGTTKKFSYTHVQLHIHDQALTQAHTTEYENILLVAR